MRIEFPLNLNNPDPEADAFIRDHILVNTLSPQEQFVAWYGYMEKALPFPFEGSMLVRQTQTTRSYRNVIIKRMAEMSKCGPNQLWVYGELPYTDHAHFYFFLADMSGFLDKIDVYKPVYLWKYWLNKQSRV